MVVPDYIHHDEQARTDWIKVELRSRGLNYTIVAERLKKSRQAASQGINSKNLFWQRKIAEAIDLRPEDIWPECYPQLNKGTTQNESEVATT